MAEFPTEDDLWGLSDEAREFITFVVRNMNRSYKPVMLLCLLDLADGQWRVSLDALSLRFLSFYLNRVELGYAGEISTSIMQRPGEVNIGEVRRLLIDSPLACFLENGYAARRRHLHLLPEMLWERLSDDDIAQFRRISRHAVNGYFNASTR
jgi:hypothetical protein